MAKKKIFISYGEKSGEKHSIPIIKLLADEYNFEGLSGDFLTKMGYRTLYTFHDTAVLGFTEVAAKYFRFRKMVKATCEHIRLNRPDLVMLVDYPGFNLQIAAYAKKIGIPTLYYIAPKTWAWGEWRAKKFPLKIDKLAVIFPFEENYFRAFGVNAEFVGNPNVELEDIVSACPTLQNKVLGILPGSRSNEIKQILPPCIDAAKQLMNNGLFSKTIISNAENIKREELSSLIDDNRIDIVNGTDKILRDASFLFVKSGTVTLQAALALKPFIAVYKVSRISALIIRRIIKIPFVSMVNIMAKAPIVPEILQENLTKKNLIAETEKLLSNTERLREMTNKFSELKSAIEKTNPSLRVAQLIREMA